MAERLAALQRRSQESSNWWVADEALAVIADELTTSNFCVLDGMLGHETLASLRQEVLDVKGSGMLKASQLGGGRNGGNLAFTHSDARGDDIGWFTGGEAALWPDRTLEAYLERLDTLLASLAQRVPQLSGTSKRSKAMVACYPGGGARYVRHHDNSCSLSEGEHCNGRRLTAILYLNEGWEASHGGELRVYPPYEPDAAKAKLTRLREWLHANAHAYADEEEFQRVFREKLEGVSTNDDAPALCDVAPLSDRLVLFYSDYRVPHEVLPAHRDRLAVTVWCVVRGAETSGRRECERASARPSEGAEAQPDARSQTRSLAESDSLSL